MHRGYCRYGKDRSSLIKQDATVSALKCHQDCQASYACVAFSFSTDLQRGCVLYGGGPYTHGNGRQNSKCYIVYSGKHYANA